MCMSWVSMRARLTRLLLGLVVVGGEGEDTQAGEGGALAGAARA